MTQELSIPPNELITAITEGRPVLKQDAPGEAWFVCDGVRLAYAVEVEGLWRARSLACDHPCHRPHPRYQRAYDQLYREFGALLPPRTPETECPKCHGDGLLPIDSVEAQQLFMHVVAMQIYKGVVLTSEKYEAPALNAEALRATIATFLTGGENSPAAFSDSPAGTVPGRAHFAGDEIKE